MTALRIALAQINVTVGDLDGNRRRIEAAIHTAQAQVADVVVLPELAVTGYPPEDLLLKPQFVDANQRALRQLTTHVRGLLALVGFVDQGRRGVLHNAAAALAHGRRLAVYDKQCLPNYGVFDEKRYFLAGVQPLLLDVCGVRIGVTICEDLWEERPGRELARAGAQLLVNLSASPYHAGKVRERERLFSRRARQHNVAVAYCNLVGGQDELVFDGASFVLDRRGRPIGRAALFREEMICVDLEEADLGPRRPRRLSRAARITLPRRSRPPMASTKRPWPQRVEEVYEALTMGLRDYVRKNGFSTVVLGLSGGVDSALTACLAVDALGPAHVRGIVMPSRFSSRATQRDAKILGHTLGIEVHEISIEPVFRAYLHTLAPRFADRAVDVTEQNLQARIRGNLLMALSNKFGWLVLTTGNKSEMATGYCTLYGDMAGGFAVIKDVPKMLVYQLARFRNARGLGAPIPRSVLRRAPTAELAPHQTDQETLPPYPVLDGILKAYVEEDHSLRTIARRLRAPAGLVRRVLRMVDRSEYKRRQGPPGIKITPKAFGRDRRIPITNQFEES